MSFVIRKDGGVFASGRNRWTAKWVEDLSKARVFPRRSDALISATTTFARTSRVYGGSSELPEGWEILPVKVVLA